MTSPPDSRVGVQRPPRPIAPLRFGRPVSRPTHLTYFPRLLVKTVVKYSAGQQTMHHNGQRSRLPGQLNYAICTYLRAGATGLEPATYGVTGRRSPTGVGFGLWQRCPTSHRPRRLGEGRRRVGAGSRPRQASVRPERFPPQIQPRFVCPRHASHTIGFSRANTGLFVSSACPVLVAEISTEKPFRRSAWPLRRSFWRFACSGR